MKRTLREITADDDPHYSQFGEAAMIDWLIRVLGLEVRYVVEFGASTGPELSNTWHLAEAGAPALYIEADHEKWEQLTEAARSLPNAATLRHRVEDIDPWLTETPTVMSIDVDGEDLAIFRRMEARPSIVVIEHHPMIPAHVFFDGGEGFGASAKAIHWAAGAKGYWLAGMTSCNCILVDATLPRRHPADFISLETSMARMFDPTHVTYVVSNVYNGDYRIEGTWPFGRGEELP